jgi:peptidoglycan hydrolase CwlO-like protein
LAESLGKKFRRERVDNRCGIRGNHWGGLRMSAIEILTLVISIVGAISAICAIVAFFINRGKDKYEKGNDDGNIRGDIKYMRNSFDDLRLDVKEVSRKQDALSERLVRVEESTKSAHKRIDTLEKQINHTED